MMIDELLSLAASTKSHHLDPTINIIEAEDSGTNDEEYIPDGGLSAPEIISQLKDLTPHGERLITKFKDPPLFLFSNISSRHTRESLWCEGQEGPPAHGHCRRHHAMGRRQLGHHASHQQGQQGDSPRY